MRKCSRCGADLDSESKFCASCGTEAVVTEIKSAPSADETKVFEDIQQTVAEFRRELEKADTERKTFGSERAMTAQKIDRISDRIDQLEAKSQRPPAAPLVESRIPGSEKKAFDIWARGGSNAVTPEIAKLLVPDAIKALTSMNDPSTGYLVPSESLPGIIKGITVFSPLRKYARVRETSNRSVIVTKRTGTFSASWVGETETKTEATGLSYGQEEVFTKEMSALVDVSQIDLEDNAFNLESELEMEFGEQFGLAEGTAFISGSGPKQPEGILTSDDVAYSAGGDASAITADGMIALYYDLKDAYARNAVWFMRRATLKAIRQLKIVATGEYVWQPGLQPGEPGTILGRPYEETPDMPAIAADAFPVLFGDLRRGYHIADRLAISIIRDSLTQAGSGVVRFIARKRVGGMVILAEAMRKLKIATS